MQIYCSFDPRNPDSLNEARSKLEKCVCELSQWLASNMLKLNEDNTEILVVSSSRLRPTGDMSLHIGKTTVDISNTVKNLGVYFDQTLSMSDHVRRVCQIANFHLRNISHVRKYLTEDACNHAVRSLVLSRLDYGNSLLANINASDVKRLQKKSKIEQLVWCLVRGEENPVLLYWNNCTGFPSKNVLITN